VGRKTFVTTRENVAICVTFPLICFVLLRFENLRASQVTPDANRGCHGWSTRICEMRSMKFFILTRSSSSLFMHSLQEVHADEYKFLYGAILFRHWPPLVSERWCRSAQQQSCLSITVQTGEQEIGDEPRQHSCSWFRVP
jgi:hypothetical protein